MKYVTYRNDKDEIMIFGNLISENRLIVRVINPDYFEYWTVGDKYKLASKNHIEDMKREFGSKVKVKKFKRISQKLKNELIQYVL